MTNKPEGTFTGGIGLTSNLTEAAPWPNSLGSIPTSVVSINHNDYPVSGTMPQGVLQQYAASMIVPSSYTNHDWPNVNYAAYAENRNPSPGGCTVNYFGTSTVNGGAHTRAANFNGVVANSDAAHAYSGSNHGVDFGKLSSLEINVNVWFKAGGVAPCGVIDGISLIGGGDTGALPAGGAFGVRFFPIAGYGGPTYTNWTYLLYSEDGAAKGTANGSGFASIGAQGVGNGVASQPIIARARTSDGTNIQGYIEFEPTNNWYISKPLMLSTDSTQVVDPGALLQANTNANGLQVPVVLRNDNGNSPIVAIGFNVAATSSLEDSVPKAGIGMIRNAPQGVGDLIFFNRNSSDSSAFTSADEVMRIAPSGDTTFLGGFTSKGAASGIGYAAGSGGMVSQMTSKSTSVTLNKVNGQIAMNTASLEAGAKVSFALANSAIAATDIPVVCVASGGTPNAYRASVTAVASGYCNITVENITGKSLSESPVIGFAIIKAVTS